MTKPVSLIADLLDLLDAERRYEFEERAGILEFDANVPRDDAECLALIDLLRTHPAALVQVTVLKVERNGDTQFVLTSEVDRARDTLAAQNATVVDVVNLAEIIRSQFGGMALISRGA